MRGPHSALECLLGLVTDGRVIGLDDTGLDVREELLDLCPEFGGDPRVPVVEVGQPDSPVAEITYEGTIRPGALNVLLNGLEAMPEGGRLAVRGKLEDGTASIEIADTGSGIPDDLRGRIFDPYFTTKSTGSGMGLAICEKIMQQHSGRIDFVSGPNGTSFTLTMPTEET